MPKGQPFAASNESEPEPDVAIVPSGNYVDRHPDRALLIIEVAESSPAYDRETKAPIYAASGVPEYWIVDVAGRAVEVHAGSDGQRILECAPRARGRHSEPVRLRRHRDRRDRCCALALLQVDWTPPSAWGAVRGSKSAAPPHRWRSAGTDRPSAVASMQRQQRSFVWSGFVEPSLLGMQRECASS
jgi:hypothetical protein